MSVDLGIFVIRAIFGLAMAAHASQKLFGWFGGYGLKATGGFFETLGFRPGAAFAAAAGLSEFGGVLDSLPEEFHSGAIVSHPGVKRTQVVFRLRKCRVNR